MLRCCPLLEVLGCWILPLRYLPTLRQTRMRTFATSSVRSSLPTACLLQAPWRLQQLWANDRDVRRAKRGLRLLGLRWWQLVLP